MLAEYDFDVIFRIELLLNVVDHEEMVATRLFTKLRRSQWGAGIQRLESDEREHPDQIGTVQTIFAHAQNHRVAL